MCKAYQQYYMTYYYYSNYGMTFQMSGQMEDGTTVGQSLLDFGVDTAVAYAVAAQRAQDNGVSLSEENAAALETLYSDNVTSYGEDRWQAYVDAGLINESDYTVEQRAEWIQTEGKSFYQHSLMYYATTPQAYQDTFTNIYYFNTLRDNLFGEGGEYAPRRRPWPIISPPTSRTTASAGPGASSSPPWTAPMTPPWPRSRPRPRRSMTSSPR